MIGEAAGLACAAAWAVISLVMRSVARDAAPMVVNGFRCLVASLVLLLIVVLGGRLAAFETLAGGKVFAIVVSGLMGQALGDALFVSAAAKIGAARTLPISASSPLLTVMLAALLLGEVITSTGIAGTFLVLGGVFLLAFPYGTLRHAKDLVAPADATGVLFAFAAAGCWAVSTIILREALVGVDLLAANLVRLTTAWIILLGLHRARLHGAAPGLGLSRRALGVMVAAGVLSAFSSLMYLTSVAYAGAAKASVLNATSPLFGLPLSLIFLKERITRRIVVGTLLTVIGIWLVVLQ